MEKIYKTNYYKAVHFLGNNLIRLNNIPEIDDSVYENFQTFPEDQEVFQWYLTDCTDDDVKYLTKHFDLLFTYSDKLDLWVLCVTHFGTMWKGVSWETDLKVAEDND